MYQYEILNYWNSQDDLYVNYSVENLETNEKANVISYYNTSDIGCDYNGSSVKDVENTLLKLIENNNGIEFKMNKTSELSPILQYLYDCTCENESNMCHIDYNEWTDIKDESYFLLRQTWRNTVQRSAHHAGKMRQPADCQRH